MKKIIILLMSIFILSCETLQNSARELSRSFIEENKKDKFKKCLIIRRK